MKILLPSLKVIGLTVKCMLRHLRLISLITLTGLIISSCSPYIWMAIASGFLEGISGSTYNTPDTSNDGTYYYSAPSSSSSSSTAPRKCSWCNGTGNCKTCGGTGRVYEYGPLSISTHEKYEQRCGVCNGTGKCGVCDGKGSV